MDIDRVPGTQLPAHLADRFQKGQTLDITDGPADLDDRHIHIAITRNLFDATLDLIGNVGNDLNSFSQIIASAFFGDDRIINFASRNIAIFGKKGVGEAFVVAQVQVRFGAVVGHINLAVLERVHGAGVHIKIRIAFDDGCR